MKVSRSLSIPSEHWGGGGGGFGTGGRGALIVPLTSLFFTSSSSTSMVYVSTRHVITSIATTLCEALQTSFAGLSVGLIVVAVSHVLSGGAVAPGLGGPYRRSHFLMANCCPV